MSRNYLVLFLLATVYVAVISSGRMMPPPTPTPTPPPICPPNEMWACKNTNCETCCNSPMKACAPDICPDGYCTCMSGYLRNKDTGVCVLPCQCDC